jgi:hypothetical protein
LTVRRRRILKLVKTLESLDFGLLARAAVAHGLEVAAVLDVDGKALAVAGALDDNEARAIAAVVTNCMRSADVLARMLDGELIESTLDQRVVGIGIAARCVFVVVVPDGQLHAAHAGSDSFRFGVERMISRARADFSGLRTQRVDDGGSSSGPAELPVVEWGLTVRRKA